MKMIRPIYLAYLKTDRKDLAIAYFNKYKTWYHPIARARIAKDIFDWLSKIS